MHANNEIGTIQPLAEISKVVKEKGILLHSDAAQTVGHIPFNVDALGADLLSVSAHKLYGPKGVGALYVRKGTKMISLLHGGAQERGYRASTENVPAIVGLGVAAEVVLEEMLEERTRLIPLRDKLIKGILDIIPDTQLNGHPSLRLPNNVNISFKYIEGEAMLLNLDLQGIAASSGSACSSGSTEPSHVLSAIGLAPEVARGSVRFTLGRLVKEEDINVVLEVLPKIVEKLRAMSPLAKK
jgi:cysteine desulfurase